jgi:hypothetical protein
MRDWKIVKKCENKGEKQNKKAVAVVMDMGLHREWQWENGSGTVGKRRSGRFEWW